MTPGELVWTRGFIAAIATRLGLRIDERIASTVIHKRAAARNLSVGEYLGRFEEPGELRALATELTTGETYFFRQPEQLDAFVEVALPARLASPVTPRRLEILSAGCSTGEEPYTIAMLLHGRVPPGWTVAIHGVDLDARALAHAARARYTRWSLRAVSPELERRWFTREGDGAVLSPAIRGAVTFAEHNLILDSELWQRRWDIVFCRNMMMYLTEPHADQLVERMTSALAPGGYLFVGYAEALRPRTPTSITAELQTLSSHGAFYYVRSVPELAAIEPAVNAAAATRLALATDALRSQISTLILDERFDDARAVLATVPPVTGDRELLLLSALVHLSLGELDDVEHDCQRALALDAGSAVAHYLLAQCHETTGDTGGAIDHARMARALDPSFALAHLQLGRLARRSGDATTARGELATALTLLETEDSARLALYGGGFGRGALAGMCRAELDALGGLVTDDATGADELRAAFDAGFAEPVARPVPQTDVLAIHAGGAPYAIARAEIAALRVDLAVVDLPSPAAALIGIAAVRGELVPVWDLGRLTHGEPVRARRWCAIVRGGRAAIAFDRLDAHLRVPLPLGASIVLDRVAYPVLDLAGVLAGSKGAPYGR